MVPELGEMERNGSKIPATRGKQEANETCISMGFNFGPLSRQTPANKRQLRAVACCHTLLHRTPGQKGKVFPPKDYCTCAKIKAGGIPSPLKNDGKIVSWDSEIPNWMENHNPHVPNHQPGMFHRNSWFTHEQKWWFSHQVMFQTTKQKSCC